MSNEPEDWERDWDKRTTRVLHDLDKFPHSPTGGLRRGRNLMTPEIIKNIVINGEVVEVSFGSGIYYEPLYGISFAAWGDDRSTVKYTWAEALAYLEQLESGDEDEEEYQEGDFGIPVEEVIKAVNGG